MIISSSDGRLYPRQKCSIHSKMIQEDKLPTAMPFFPHSFFVYLKSFMQVKGHSKGVRITHSRYSVSHIRIPSTASIQKPDKILAAHIAGFPFDDLPPIPKLTDRKKGSKLERKGGKENGNEEKNRNSAAAI